MHQKLEVFERNAIVTNEHTRIYFSFKFVLLVSNYDIYTPILKRESANQKEEGGKKKKGLKIDSGHNGGTVYYSFEGSMNKRLDSIVDIGVTLYVTEADVTTCRAED